MPASVQTASAGIVRCVWADIGIGILLAPPRSSVFLFTGYLLFTVFRERRESLGPHPSVPPSSGRGQQLQSRHAWVGRLHHPSGDHIWLIWQNHFYPKWMHTIYLSICNFKDGEYIRVN